QVDTFDYKPALARLHGRSLNAAERPDVFFGQVGLLRQSDWAFRQRGRSGLWVSDLFPHLAGVADELTVINSMFAETSNHTPATFQENSGFRLNGFPALGAWLSYGLGSESDDLPAFVVIPDARENPAGGPINWSNGFLPARHQGVVLRGRGAPLAAVHALYGLDRPETADFGRGCLLARRLLERGVRFVQLFAGGTFGSPRRNWDGHENLAENHAHEAARVDRPVAALLKDLRQRGL